MVLDGGNVFGVAADPTHAYPVSENHTSPNALSTKCAAAASHVEECERSDAETMSALDLLAPAHQPAQIIELFRSACTVEGADGVEGADDGEPAQCTDPPPEEEPWENRLCEACDAVGESLVTFGPASEDATTDMFKRLEQVASTVSCEVTRIHRTSGGGGDKGSVEKPSKVSPRSVSSSSLHTTYAMVRKLPSQGHHLDLRVAVVGNVDAGKSTLVGILTGPTSFLDDGRGLARSRVLRHKHEAETGRTSSIGEEQHLRLSSRGECLATSKHQKSVDASCSAKVVSFIDLAGHEKYLRTTVYGLTAHEPDYVMVVVGANHGITRMTKEHVGMAIALNVPLFVVVTKVDLCPEPVMKETLKQLSRLLKLPGAKKQPYAVRTMDELMTAVRSFGRSALTPVFSISSVDGTNVPLLRDFFNLMPSRRPWAQQSAQPPEFLIDQHFTVPGVGHVVAGTLVSGVISLNQIVLMGPDTVGKFNPVTVKSIHHMRTAVPALLPGQTGAFVVRSRTKEHVREFGIRKGMVMLPPPAAASKEAPPTATRRFVCDVLVLHSQTTMRLNYQPILYARNVRQCVRIVEMNKELLRTGIRARVTFEFMYRSEYIREGTKVLFTEGKTKALGSIRELLS